jgi:transposase
MKPYIRIQLSEEELKNARKIHKTGLKHHIRQKAHALLLSHSGKIVTEIASILSYDEETIRSWFNKWKTGGFESFEIKKGRGLKPKISTQDTDSVDFIKKSRRESIESKNLSPEYFN